MALKFFYNVYKTIDESIRRSYVIDIIVNEEGHINLGVGTEYREETSDNTYFSLENIKNTSLIYDQLCSKDKKLIDSLILAEGDIIITNFDYETDQFKLISLIYSNDIFSLTKNEIINNKYILNRINKRHLNTIYESS